MVRTYVGIVLWSSNLLFSNLLYFFLLLHPKILLNSNMAMNYQEAHNMMWEHLKYLYIKLLVPKSSSFKLKMGYNSINVEMVVYFIVRKRTYRCEKIFMQCSCASSISPIWQAANEHLLGKHWKILRPTLV